MPTVKKSKTRKTQKPKGFRGLARKAKLSLKRGGMKYLSGADTCVFRPVVECKGGTPSPYLNDGFASRIVPAESDDVKTEKYIGARFPELVKMGWVSVGSHFCTPQFKSTNMKERTAKVAGAPCSKITEDKSSDFANMITKWYDGGDFSTYVTKQSYSIYDIFAILQAALNAAVALVPDAGPWVVHTDCHTGNILVSDSGGYSAIADWGRCIIVEDPNSINSMGDAIAQYLNQHTLGSFDKMYCEWENIYSQHPVIVQKEMHNFFKNLVNASSGRSKSLDHKRSGSGALRGWTAYAILNCALKNANQDTNILDPILRTTSQYDLQETINNILDMPGYISSAAKPPAPVPIQPIIAVVNPARSPARIKIDKPITPMEIDYSLRPDPERRFEDIVMNMGNEPTYRGRTNNVHMSTGLTPPYNPYATSISSYNNYNPLIASSSSSSYNNNAHMSTGLTPPYNPYATRISSSYNNNNNNNNNNNAHMSTGLTPPYNPYGARKSIVTIGAPYATKSVSLNNMNLNSNFN